MNRDTIADTLTREGWQVFHHSGGGVHTIFATHPDLGVEEREWMQLVVGPFDTDGELDSGEPLVAVLETVDAPAFDWRSDDHEITGEDELRRITLRWLDTPFGAEDR